MIKVMDVYQELKDTTDEVVRVFQLAGEPFNPAVVVGVANLIVLLRYLEKHRVSDSAQEALVKLVKNDKFGCPIAGCKETQPHIHAIEGPASND